VRTVELPKTVEGCDRALHYYAAQLDMVTDPEDKTLIRWSIDKLLDRRTELSRERRKRRATA
jgi:hypothetical protein